ncbi:hypothetical protein HMPREF9104_01819 [Lentilactobacillus kisonensis F0435]|uniref:Uncharacterized protein n=1 Tax=Lentilactobacillus kisonensis F0435 TaxID=797516 RepID=H1LGU0_9LACO|nr:hypothetical protein HMPREF9104_01819 [Lentilactobacillus kisonensis F0435]
MLFNLKTPLFPKIRNNGVFINFWELKNDMSQFINVRLTLANHKLMEQ